MILEQFWLSRVRVQPNNVTSIVRTVVVAEFLQFHSTQFMSETHPCCIFAD